MSDTAEQGTGLVGGGLRLSTTEPYGRATGRSNGAQIVSSVVALGHAMGGLSEDQAFFTLTKHGSRMQG